MEVSHTRYLAIHVGHVIWELVIVPQPPVREVTMTKVTNLYRQVLIAIAITRWCYGRSRPAVTALRSDGAPGRGSSEVGPLRRSVSSPKVKPARNVSARLPCGGSGPPAFGIEASGSAR